MAAGASAPNSFENLPVTRPRRPFAMVMVHVAVSLSLSSNRETGGRGRGVCGGSVLALGTIKKRGDRVVDDVGKT